MKNISRREAIKITGTTIGLTAFGLPVYSSEKNRSNAASEKKHKVLVIGAHPDDPETGCGGTMILLQKAGYEVVSVYLTRGEAGINGKTHDEAARIRTAEALKACEVIGARAVFLSQIDGSCEITADRYKEVLDLIKKEDPELVLTHWPVDSHRDHRICSDLVYDAWLRMNRGFALYYFEVESGIQTENFSPTDFVDITDVVDLKHKACYCHVSQKVEEVYKEAHKMMEEFRGLQIRRKYGEAFIRHDQVPTAMF